MVRSSLTGVDLTPVFRTHEASSPQHLILDADDTLWENNVYFERAIGDFLAFLNHSTVTPAEVRTTLDEIERANILHHGYGAAAFARSLRTCFERLSERQVREDDVARIAELGERILRQEIEIIDGVPETLASLASRHDLLLFTKGHPEEQRLKIDRSGLADFFREAVVAGEKDEAAYRTLVEAHGLDPSRTWMIGNSPKSDINPALAAGLNAVFVPHDQTWGLERQELASGPGRLLVLERFADLLAHF